MGIQFKTDLCRILGIEYPLLLAPMAGGPSTESLVASVSNAGGLGTHGAAYLTPQQIAESIRKIRALTDKPFGVNLFAPSTPREPVDENRSLDKINEIRSRLGLSSISDIPQDRLSFDEQIRVLLQEKVPVISTTFGLIPKQYVDEAHTLGIKIITTATSVEEAVLAEQSGSDLIVAQGAEAGGHRGTFDTVTNPLGHNVGTFALVPQIADRVRVPVIAAGGIMDGRGLVAALALGAQGAQIGTRFLTSQESGAHPAYQKALLASTEIDTDITDAFSGRPARGVVNAFMRLWNDSSETRFPFPIQNSLTREIRKKAADQGDADFMSLWAGQGLRLLKQGEPAASIVSDIVQEAKMLLKAGREDSLIVDMEI